jgi:hypothetical protein
MTTEERTKIAQYSMSVSVTLACRMFEISMHWVAISKIRPDNAAFPPTRLPAHFLPKLAVSVPPLTLPEEIYDMRSV